MARGLSGNGGRQVKVGDLRCSIVWSRGFGKGSSETLTPDGCQNHSTTGSNLPNKRSSHRRTNGSSDQRSPEKKGIQPAHPSSLGSHHFFVATAATRWMAPNVHHAAGPPSGDGGYNAKSNFGFPPWRKATPWNPALGLRFKFAGFEGSRSFCDSHRSVFQGRKRHGTP